MKSILSTLLILIFTYSATATAQPAYDYTKLKREKLGRGVIAIRHSADSVCVLWRYLSSDPMDTGFHVYRNGKKLTDKPILTSTCFYDNYTANAKAEYKIVPVSARGKELKSSGTYMLQANAPIGYLPIPLDKPADGVTPSGQKYTYAPNDASIGDVDDDGEYEIILKWDPSNAHDNSHDGYTGNVLFDCYRLDGTKLWRIDMGRNIRTGAHYTQFMVFDLNGDGKAEIVMKTSDGTVDGKGKVIGDANADYRASNGHILTGAEYLTVFSGKTGEALHTIDYIPQRGNLMDWGDNRANRSERYLACVAYLDGIHPSVVMCRGYYTRTVLAAYDWDGRKLKQRWVFDSNEPRWANYAGQGNHNLRVADVDGDGCDEIIYGSCTIDNDGTGLYNTEMGHGDAIHLTQFDPSNPRLQVWDCHENRRDGSSFRDAATGEVLFQIKSNTDVGRAMAADIDPTNKGVEMWSLDSRGIRNFKGEVVNARPQRLPVNMAVWWDGDLLREMLDKNVVSKYNWVKGICEPLVRFEGALSNNGSKSNPCLQGDIIGDWREEVFLRTEDNTALRLYVSTIPTDYRFHTFLEDPVYRISIATQNVAYNQPTQPGFYFGPDLKGEFRGTIIHKAADKPLFRDPKYDGAADPVVIWNEKEERWFMFYTNRRANMQDTKGVDWVHGTPIGIAESTDGGATWTYKCDANIDYGKDLNYTYWAPDIIKDGDSYHMFLTVVPGIFTDWNHGREIVHLVSDNLIDWTFGNKCELISDKVIDAGVVKTPDGKWRMYYNNERDNKSIYYSETTDFIHWTNYGKVIADQRGEGPKVFYWKDKYFMIVDNWNGQGVYSSPDMENWTRQKNNILGEGGNGKDDQTYGLHADVVVNNDRAFIFYFTHPGRTGNKADSYDTRRSSIQVAELEYINGEIVCNRNKPVYINLKP